MNLRNVYTPLSCFDPDLIGTNQRKTGIYVFNKQLMAEAYKFHVEEPKDCRKASLASQKANAIAEVVQMSLILYGDVRLLFHIGKPHARSLFSHVISAPVGTWIVARAAENDSHVDGIDSVSELLTDHQHRLTVSMTDQSQLIFEI